MSQQRISAEKWKLKKDHMEILELKMIIIKINNSLAGLNRRLEVTEKTNMRI